MTEEQLERCYLRRVVGEVLTVLILSMIVLSLTGCAEMAKGPYHGICAMLPIGQNEQDAQFFRYQCQPGE